MNEEQTYNEIKKLAKNLINTICQETKDEQEFFSVLDKSIIVDNVLDEIENKLSELRI